MSLEPDLQKPDEQEQLSIVQMVCGNNNTVVTHAVNCTFPSVCVHGSEENHFSALDHHALEIADDRWQKREEEEIFKNCLVDASIRLISLTGAGGYGKSTLAARLYADVTIPEFEGRFWIDFKIPQNFDFFCRELLKLLGAPKINEQAGDDLLAAAIVNYLSQHRVLLVFDNLETLLNVDGTWQLSGYQAFLSQWLEKGQQSTILMTSREQPVFSRRWEDRYHWHQLAGLSIESGVNLLRRFDIAGEEREFVEFVVRADGHPLLLEFTNSFIRQQAEEDNEAPSIQVLKRPGFNLYEIVEEHRGDPETSVKTLLEFSLARLSANHRQLLLYLSVYRLPFDKAGATAMGREEVKNEDLRGLVRRSLLQEKEQNNYWRFQFQPLIQSYLQQTLEENEIDADAHQRAIDYYFSVALKTVSVLEDITEYEEIFHHKCMLGMYSWVVHQIEVTGLVDFINRLGANSKLVKLFEPVLQVWQPEIDEQPIKERLLIILGSAYLRLSKYEQAKECFQQSLEFVKQINEGTIKIGALDKLNEQDQSSYYIPVKAQALNLLGAAFQGKRQYDEAIGCYQQAFLLCQDMGNFKSELGILNNLAIVYNKKGLNQDAIDILEKVLEFDRLNGDNRQQAGTLCNLACAYRDIDVFEKAIEYYEEAKTLLKDAKHREFLANVLDGLGLTYYYLRKYNEVITFSQQARQIYKEIEFTDGEITALGHLIDAYENLQEYQKAIMATDERRKLYKRLFDQASEANCFIQIVNLCEKSGDLQTVLRVITEVEIFLQDVDEAVIQAPLFERIGSFLYRHSQFEKAASFLNHAASKYFEINNLESYAACLGNAGETYLYLEQHSNAIKFAFKAANITHKINHNHFECMSVMAMGNIHLCLHDDEANHQATIFYKKAIMLAYKIDNQSMIGRLLNNLLVISINLKEYPQAQKYGMQALKIFRNLGIFSDECVCLMNLGCSSADQGNHSRAVSFYQQALEVNDRSNNIHHQACALFSLGNSLVKLDEKWEAKSVFEQARGLFTSMRLANWVEKCDKKITDLGEITLVSRHRFLHLQKTQESSQFRYRYKHPVNLLSPIPMDFINTLIPTISPFLPFLLDLGSKASQEAAEKFGSDGAWVLAKAIWAKLSPKIATKEATKEAVVDLAKDPTNTLYQDVFKNQLQKIFEADPQLKDAIVQLLEQATSNTPGMVQIYQEIKGNGNTAAVTIHDSIITTGRGNEVHTDQSSHKTMAGHDAFASNRDVNNSQSTKANLVILLVAIGLFSLGMIAWTFGVRLTSKASELSTQGTSQQPTPSPNKLLSKP
jgi:tetratricopeptide (TPR) repeat protein